MKISLAQIRLRKELKEYEKLQEKDRIRLILPERENLFQWHAILRGPPDTPYEGGIFKIIIIFPNDYPKKGAEFRFENEIYHLNVESNKNDKFGHICLSSLNEWFSTGKVATKPGFAVKQALFDIFCLFYNQGTESPYSPQMAKQYRDDPKKFNQIAKEWTKKYAS